MLKANHGLGHAAAHRVSLLTRQRDDTGADPAPSDPADALYTGAKAGLRPLRDALLGQIRTLGAVDLAPKRGYLSLRRRKQFAMVQPSTTGRIDLGLILPPTTPATGGWSRRPGSTRCSLIASASPQPLTSTTSFAAGLPPPTDSPGSPGRGSRVAPGEAEATPGAARQNLPRSAPARAPHSYLIATSLRPRRCGHVSALADSADH